MNLALQPPLTRLEVVAEPPGQQESGSPPAISRPARTQIPARLRGERESACLGTTRKLKLNPVCWWYVVSFVFMCVCLLFCLLCVVCVMCFWVVALWLCVFGGKDENACEFGGCSSHPSCDLPLREHWLVEGFDRNQDLVLVFVV